MTEKRFHYDWKTGRFKDTQSKSCATTNMRVLETQINNACFNYEKKIEKLEKENKELKEEVQLLKEGIEAYENAIPYVCTCGQVNNIHSEMFDFWMKQNKFYMEHPSRCTVIIDGVRYNDRE